MPQEEFGRFIQYDDYWLFNKLVYEGENDKIDQLLDLTHKRNTKLAEDMLHSHSDSCFYGAVEVNNLPLVKLLLHHSHNPIRRYNMIHDQDDFDDSSNLAFVTATRKCSIEMMQLLIDETPEKEARDKMLQTSNDMPFFAAVSKNDQEKIKLIWKYYDEPKRNEMTNSELGDAFIIAATYGQNDLITFLLGLIPHSESKNQNVEATIRKDNDLAFHRAAEGGHTTILQLLLNGVVNEDDRAKILSEVYKNVLKKK